MTDSSTTTLQELLAQVGDDFLHAEQLEQSDDEVANAALEWILKRERVRYQVTTDAQAAQAVDQLTIRKMLEWDSDDPAMSTVEKILRRLAEGRGSSAMALIRSLQDKAQKISDEMRRRASVPREQHPVVELIEQIVRHDPAISEKLLLRKLEGKIGGEVISAITDGGLIEPFNTDYPPLKVSGLKNHLSRIKKRISQ